MTRNSFRKLSFILTAVVLSGTLYLSTTYATLAPLTPPPSGGYDAGTNSILDPGCGPTDTDCFVKPITADNGLTATGSNVQLGGILMQNTLIDQDGNDFSIINGNFSFESGINNLFSIPGIFSTYQDSTTIATMGIGEFGGASEKSPILAHSYDDGTGTTSAAQFFVGGVAGSTYTSSIGWTTNYISPTESYGSEMVNLHRTTYFRNTDSILNLSSDFAIDSNTGITFSFTGSGGEDYTFPRNDGTANQVLTSDGNGLLSWQNAGGSNWSLTGNAGTTAGTNFIGTTDAEDFVIKANGVEMGRFYESTGASAGSVALGGGTALSESMFVFGVTAGASATNAVWSNFIGYSAGQLAINASYSNFIGLESGNGATSANNSNFLGQSAGESASNAYQSNFLGWAAGGGAVNAHDSNFFGYQSGNGAVDAAYANFFGYSAGLNADEANDSNFLGNEAGSGATTAYNSNFFGTQAGYLATNAQYANFLGQAAGKNALFAQNSNFMGRFAGQDALSAQNSNFFGQSAGEGAIGASYSNFFGPSAGVTATNAQYSNFFGASAGYGATQAQNSNFFGQNTGATAVNAANSIFIGISAGNGDLVNNTTDPDDYSILIGNFTSTGNDGFGVGFSNSIALGAYATNTGSNQLQIGSTTRPISSVFIGDDKGSASTVDTFFVGTGAGTGATNADGSNFIGNNAGYGATLATQANFIGTNAGNGASLALGSNFIGLLAGNGAINAGISNFIGYEAGSGAVNAANSIFIGYGAGASDAVNNTGAASDFSILIGKDTRTGGFSNSIAIGGSATNTASNQFMIGSTTRPINTARFQGSVIGTQCTITTGTGIACTSDERLKENVVDLVSGTLDKLSNIRTVNYRLISDTSHKLQVGFLAQNLEQYFPELVDTDLNSGYKSVYYAQMTPILTQAIREMNLKITDINNTAVTNTWRDALIAWFGNIENGITNMYVKVFHADRVETKELCIDDVCITKDQLQTILNSNQIAPSPAPVPTIGDDSAPSGNDDQILPVDNPSDDGTDTGSSDQVVTPSTDTPAPVDTPTPIE